MQRTRAKGISLDGGKFHITGLILCQHLYLSCLILIVRMAEFCKAINGTTMVSSGGTNLAGGWFHISGNVILGVHD